MRRESGCKSCKHRIKPKIKIDQYCDGFAIMLLDNDDEIDKIYSFNQEDTVEKLADLFRILGYDSTYEDI